MTLFIDWRIFFLKVRLGKLENKIQDNKVVSTEQLFCWDYVLMYTGYCNKRINNIIKRNMKSTS